jgi:hypothetical protein
VVVGSTAVVVGPLVGGSVLVVVTRVVVVGADVVVGPIEVVGGAVVVVGPVTGGWVLVAPKVEKASVLVVVPAVAGAWALTDPATVVGPLAARGPVVEIGVERVGAVVGARGRGLGAAVTVGAAGWPRPPGRPGHRW